MSVDASRMGQSAANQPPGQAASVAPTATPRVLGPAPEYGPIPQAYQPVAGSQGSSAPGQPQQSYANPVPQAPVRQQAPPQQMGTPAPASPDPNADARLRQMEAERSRERQELEQYRRTVGQIQQYATEQQRSNQTNQEIQMVLAQAENMPASDASTYLRNQMTQLIGRERLSAAQERQALEQQHQQQVRTIAAPQYADHLIETMGISPSARAELMALGDPDLMFRQAPFIKSRYDQMNQFTQQFQGNQQQLARTQEVQAMQQAGYGTFGGQSGVSSFQMEVSDDPDIAAMQVLHALRAGPQ